jgi:hypothetical protein
MILVRLGFTRALNYEFVVNNAISVAQIFEFTPQGINYGLDTNNTKMHSLQPYDTRASKGYITTLALAYIVKDLYDELDLERHTPSSALLNNPDKPVCALMNLLDPSIPLLATADEQAGGDNSDISDNDLPGGSNNKGTDPDPGSSGQDGAPISGSSGKISAKSAGIGAGVVCGALVYGAAMFFVARRYRQRRAQAGHSRVDSLSRSGSPGNGGAGALMAGPVGVALMHGAGTYGATDNRGGEGGGRSISPRGANISAPVMAENSLGWS